MDVEQPITTEIFERSRQDLTKRQDDLQHGSQSTPRGRNTMKEVAVVALSIKVKGTLQSFSGTLRSLITLRVRSTKTAKQTRQTGDCEAFCELERVVNKTKLEAMGAVCNTMLWPICFSVIHRGSQVTFWICLNYMSSEAGDSSGCHVEWCLSMFDQLFGIESYGQIVIWNQPCTQGCHLWKPNSRQFNTIQIWCATCHVKRDIQR